MDLQILYRVETAKIQYIHRDEEEEEEEDTDDDEEETE